MAIKRKKTISLGLKLTVTQQQPFSQIGEIDEIYRSHSYNPMREEQVQDTITIICECLAVSGYQAASDLRQLKEKNITHILNTVGHKHPNHFPDDFIYKQFVLADEGNQSILQAIEESISFIEEVEKCGGRLLIHCEQGKSRSPTLVAAYLMMHRGMDENQAVDFLQSKRPQVDPNLGFMLQLAQLRKPQEQIFTITKEDRFQQQVIKSCEIQELSENNCKGVIAYRKDRILIWGKDEKAVECSLRFKELLCKFNSTNQELLELIEFSTFNNLVGAF